MRKKSIFICGLVTGLAASMSLTAFGAPTVEAINAYINHSFRFVFDGQEQALPEGYYAVVYGGKSYVPAKFIAEKLGATVEWDDATKTVNFTMPPAKEVIVTVPAVSTQPAVSTPAEEKPADDAYNYKKLPQTRDMDGYRVSLTGYSEKTQNIGDRLHLKVVNDESGSVQVDQSQTKYIVKGTTYKTSAKDSIDADGRWYSDIAEDQTVDGYLVMPSELKDAENIHVEILVHTNRNYNLKDDIIEFDIAL